ncbi:MULTISPECIES: heavy metal-responsive transcriptional regulator [Deinococcus]|uniref:DNA-binding transcriptional regulator, MerR family n=4 Tax=Deinococcus TaxID=1298 RepID=A0A1H7C5Z0_9DEIO|nr:MULTISPECIES: heavy metal-responsive transcriptional regulator [Deinococcus]MCY1703722.1 heavy metal-responsive transcriptional regulator [Deinococcus sp. SL84]MCY1703793.1 heavy metal-responsive transcriptional regulator [Deinococcus sp. SL84]MDL2343033.1 heavy metal-responsive transcriptional regulator [Deinococcus rhizophilus]SEJ85199.1 DNA-binding transcriptional regulator, MerR family [Deinococcus reticulitermitis]
MTPQPAPLSIGQLATETGERVKTLRYWTDLGLLQHERKESGYRMYTADSAERVQFIRSAQRVGFTLGDIARILSLRAEGQKPCTDVRDELQVHLQAVRQQLAQLQALEAELAGRLAYAQAHPDPECDTPGCVYLNLPSP